jgi:hypothetical protein
VIGLSQAGLQHTDYAAVAWVPQFVDYLSLAFWTATAVSPI